MKHKNLDDILKEIPELHWIVTAAYHNSQNSGAGRKHGELTKKELYSYTKCLIKELKKRSKKNEH